ncbi:F-box domain containing protein [Tanacetum coccineum]
MDIMNRLPVKSLLQFRAVSKQWKFSIDSFDFIRNYGCREINTYTPEHVGVGEFSPPYYISQLGDSLIISGGFGFGAFRIIYAWALDFEDGIISSCNLLFTIPHPADYIAMPKMAPYEAFACRCGKGDVVLRELYQPNAHEERVRLLLSSLGSSSTPSYSSEPSSPNSYSSGSTTPQNHGSTTPQNHQSGTSISGGCSNCKHLLGKIKVLEAAVEMHMHPEQHTRNSTALLHELYNDMDNLGLE